MNGWVGLFLPLVLAMAALAGLLALAARRLGCGRREARRALLCGALATAAALAPYLAGARFLPPTGRLGASPPGAPASASAVDPYDDQLNDAILQFLPWEIEIRRALAAGHLPFWSERLDGGSSPWANPQAQALSPFALLARAAPLPHFLLVVLALRLLAAFSGTALLARRLGVGKHLALAAAASYALGGALVGFAVFPHGGPAALAPWSTLALVHLARGGRTGATTAAFLVAATLLAGHPVTAAGALALALVVVAAARRRRALVARSFAPVLLALALGTLLAAPQLAPFARQFAESVKPGEVDARAVLAPGDAPIFSPAAGAVAAAALNWQARLAPAPPATTSRAWLPAVSIYGGLWLVPFAALALLLPGARRLARPLVAFALVVLAGALGFAPLVAAKRALPLVATLQLPRLVPAALLALALAAGLAARHARRAPRLGPALLFASAATSLALAPRGFVAATWLELALALFVLQRRPRLGRAVVALVVALDLVSFDAVVLPRGDPGQLYAPSPLVERLVALAAAPGGPWRATGAAYLVYPSTLPAYGLAEPRPNDPPLVPRGQALALEATLGFVPVSRAYFSPLTHPEHPFLDFLAVRALLAPDSLPVPQRMRRVDSGEWPGLAIWENPAALPLAFLPRTIARVPRGDLPAWLASLDDPRRVAVGDAKDPLIESLATSNGASSSGVGTERLGTNGYRLTVLGLGTRLVATSLPALPGWSATADGRALERVTIDAGYLGIVVPAGSGVVELAFLPAGVAAGTAAAALASTVLAWRWLRRRYAGLGRRRG
ncbi:MAG: hypothetical protein U0X73_11880 [Thermoanaerobaculia bacterium]